MNSVATWRGAQSSPPSDAYPSQVQWLAILEMVYEGKVKWPPDLSYIAAVEAKAAYYNAAGDLKAAGGKRKGRSQARELCLMGFDRVALACSTWWARPTRRWRSSARPSRRSGGWARPTPASCSSGGPERPPTEGRRHTLDPPSHDGRRRPHRDGAARRELPAARVSAAVEEVDHLLSHLRHGHAFPLRPAGGRGDLHDAYRRETAPGAARRRRDHGPRRTRSPPPSSRTRAGRRRRGRASRSSSSTAPTPSAARSLRAPCSTRGSSRSSGCTPSRRATG